MSDELVRFELGEGSAGVYVEVADDDSGVERVRRRGGAPPQAVDGFEHGLDQIRDVAARTLRRITSLPAAPSTVELEFGVKFSVEAGAVIARTGVEGHLKVKMVWEKAAPDGRANQDEDEEEDEGTTDTPHATDATGDTAQAAAGAGAGA
ncbi:CU044_2847 family protein [Streptomyces sp. NRRL S-813]|uniref:CU044_2847 family protein n=1 Tax=Streptomyces sp. NRRL S-813 TaxID=1463919 RepID=UPI0007C7EE1C|nr:CU044_2847 family protein [Streptomyces sp. NRRL S-813]